MLHNIMLFRLWKGEIEKKKKMSLALPIIAEQNIKT